ncbi:MAG: hypothetical protein J5666_03480, partial [Bacilli bacterium]|nr:hypothetical protein [Bacilli bacterium]
GGEVTYSADLSNLLGKNSTSKINVDVTINVADVSFVGAKVSAELNENEATGTVSVEVEVNYKSKVATISASDKEAAVDLMTLLVETNNSIEEPSGDE